MSDRGDKYAKEVDTVFAEIGATLEQVGEDQWQAVAPADGRQINVLLDHIVRSQLSLAQLLESYAAGGSFPPLTGDDIEQGNQQHMNDATGISRGEVQATFDQGRAACRTLLPTLTDEVLDRAEYFGPFGGEVTPTIFIEVLLIGHAREHL